MEIELIAFAVTFVCGIIATSFAGKYEGAKKLIKCISDAIEDDVLTPEETQEIIKNLLALR